MSSGGRGGGLSSEGLREEAASPGFHVKVGKFSVRRHTAAFHRREAGVQRHKKGSEYP